MTQLQVVLVPVGLLMLWVLVSGLDGRGDPWPVVGALAIAAACHTAARLVPRRLVAGFALAIGAGSVTTVLLDPHALRDPLAGPLGYANANAALVVQGAAALAVAAWAGPAWMRLPCGVAVVGCLLVCLQIEAVAATTGCAVILVALLLAESDSGRRVTVALAVALGVAGSALAFLAGSGVLAPQVAATFTERRVALWSEGVDAIGDRPFTGAGARNFTQISPTAAADADTREAHAELVQRGAENGLPGLILELGAAVTVALALIRRANPVAACGLSGWTALWANAGVDWVLGFAPVVALAAVVSGLGLAREAPTLGFAASGKKPTRLVTF